MKTFPAPRFSPLYAAVLTFSIAPSLCGQQTTTTVSFNNEIRPILANHCFQCHGPDDKARQADLRLDVASEVDGEELVARIVATDADVVMPPPEANKPLNKDQVEKLRAWVAGGAAYEQHWAFVPPRVHQIPVSGASDWSEQTIDRFVVARLQQENLTPSPQADRRTLIRRLSFDLTGLPPTLEEIQAYLDDSSQFAYASLVDRLLEKPQYGEHMARYWLDLVRFADTNGLHHDHYREMSPYRDWVIRAFNDNLPFDDFITAQIAGDLYAQPTTDQLVASGFNRLHLIIDRGTALPEESFTRNVVDRVSAVGTAFLGLTLECAVCHDHKYDPITQRDFYQLFAFFNNFDGGPETGGRGGLDFRRGLQPPYLELPTPEQREQLQQIDQRIAALNAEIQHLKSAKKPATDESTTEQDAETAESDSTEGQQKALSAEIAKLNQSRDRIVEAVPATLIMKERADVRPAHILTRGNYDSPGEQVERNSPAFLPPMKNTNGLRTRMDLAEWLVDPNHPLTARVAVNRFWQQIFGVGLVKTSEDFGAQGTPPSHPELLDHLTIEFVQSGWDVKALIRSIVLSQTYQQTSQVPRDQYLADRGNRLLARGSRYRLDGEVIRDQILSVSGLLCTSLYGKSVKPPQPAGLWQIVAMPNSYPRVFQADSGDQIYRRSVYSFWKRALPPPQMTIFDAPTRESCTARRERTNTPLQALVLMNEQQYFKAAMTCANNLLKHTELDVDARLRRAFELVTSHVPNEVTLAGLRNGWQQFLDLYADDPEAAAALVTAHAADLEIPTDAAKRAELAAWTMLVHSLLNLDATKSRE